MSLKSNLREWVETIALYEDDYSVGQTVILPLTRETCKVVGREMEGDNEIYLIQKEGQDEVIKVHPEQIEASEVEEEAPTKGNHKLTNDEIEKIWQVGYMTARKYSGISLVKRKLMKLYKI